MPTILRELAAAFEAASAKGSRSTVLQPLLWLVSILVALLVAVLLVDAPRWIAAVAASLLVAVLLLIGWAFVFCLLRNPDALRSERYSLDKMRVERSLIGDDKTGMLPASNAPGQLLMGPAPDVDLEPQ